DVAALLDRAAPGGRLADDLAVFSDSELGRILAHVDDTDALRIAAEVDRQDRAASLPGVRAEDRKSTRLNSSHVKISYAVFCLKKKKTTSMCWPAISRGSRSTKPARRRRVTTVKFLLCHGSNAHTDIMHLSVATT